MKSIFLSIVLLVFDKTANAGVMNNKGRSSKIEIGPRNIAKAAATYVVNHEFCSFCMSEEENKWKETLVDVLIGL